MNNESFTMLSNYGPFGNKRVYQPVCKVEYNPFYSKVMLFYIMEVFFCIVSRWFDKLWQTSWWHKHIFVSWRIFKWENNLNPWKICLSQPEVGGVLAECWPSVCTRWPSHVPHIVMTSPHTAGSRPVNQAEKSDTRYRLVQTRTLEALIFFI